MPKLSVALRPVSARLFAVVLATVSLVAAPASAQTPPSATVTQWDIAAATATDGVTPGSTSTMRNVMAVALDETTGRIFFATLRGGTGATSGVKLGELNAAGTKLFEYRFGPGLSTTVAVPSLAWHSNGDVWMGTAATATGGGAIVLRRSEDGAGAVTVTKYTSTDFASTFSTTAATGVALAPDGQSLFFANAAGDHILRVTRTGTGSDKLPIGSTGGAPRHVALQTSGNTINAVWYVRPNGTVGRLRLQSGSWDRTEWTAPALPALPLVSTATGIHVQPTAGTLGSPLVCVTVAGLLDLVSPGLSTGEVRCLDSGADRMIRVTSPGAGYPQPITTNANGALFFTETTRDAVSFVAPSLIAAAASTPGSFDTYTESTATSITAVSITVTLTSLTELTTGTGPTTSTVTQFRRIERPTTPLVVPVSNAAVAANNVEVGYTRFLLPSPGTSVNPRPNSLSVVTGTSSTLPGTIVVGESFQSPLNSDATSNGRITRVEFGALPTTQANFTLCVKKVGDASCIPGNNFDAIAIQNTGTASQYTVTIGSTGSSLAWQARKLGADTDWLELSSPSGNTASAGTLTLTLDHLTPPLSSSPTARSATLVIDDDPSDGGPETGAPALSFIVTLTVDPPPSITLANTDTLVFHNPQQGQTKTFQVENAGGGTVNWTAMSNNPSFLSVTLQGSVGRFGTSTATVTVMTTPGVSENPDEAVIYLCTDAPNAPPPPPGLAPSVACPHVEGGPVTGLLTVGITSTQDPVTAGALVPELAGPPLAVVRGTTTAHVRELTLSKSGNIGSIGWKLWNGDAAVPDEFELDGLPAWLQLVDGSGAVVTSGTVTNTPTILFVKVLPQLIPLNPGPFTLRFGRVDNIDAGPTPADLIISVAVSASLPVVTVPGIVQLEATSAAGVAFDLHALVQANVITGLSALDRNPEPDQTILLDTNPLTPANAGDPGPWFRCTPLSATLGLADHTITCDARGQDSELASTAPAAALTFTVRVKDTIAPTFTVVPSNQVLESPFGLSIEQAFSATATDAVDGEFAVACTPTTFPVGGPHLVTCNATDAAGNAAEPATFSVTVADNTDPVAPAVTFPGGTTVSLANVAAFPIQVTGEAGADLTIVVGGVTVYGPLPLAGGAFNGTLNLSGVLGEGTVAWTVTLTDASGNSASASGQLLKDTIKPTIVVPGPITAEATGPDGALVEFEVSAYDGTPSTPVAVDCSYGPSTFPITPTPIAVVCTSQDAVGNGASASFTITVEDTTAPTTPVFTAPQTVELGTTIAFTATSTDIVGPVQVVCDPASSAGLAAGAHDVVCTATDGYGNAAAATFAVNVLDTVTPVFDPFTAPAPFEATGPAGASVTFALPTATDLGQPIPVVCTPALPVTLPVGSHSISCTANDGFNTATLLVDITVEDTTGPTIVVEPHHTIIEEAQGPGGAVVNYTVTATDLVDTDVALACFASPQHDGKDQPILVTPGDFTSGALFPLGLSSIQCQAVDDAGNSATQIITIEVVDTTPPAIAGANDLTIEATGLMTSVEFAVTADDLVDEDVLLACSATPGQSFTLGTHTVECTATDDAGNAADADFTITVQDTTVPDFDEASIPLINPIEASSFAGAVVSWATPAATDAFAVEVTCDAAPGTFALGSHTVTCTATDANGLQSEADFTFEVVDTTKPVFTSVPTDQFLESPQGNPVTQVFTATASDTVDPAVTVACAPTNFAFGGPHTVTCTATDDSGNFETATFTVTVVDTTAPLAPTVSIPDINNGNQNAVPLTLSATEGGTLNYTVTGGATTLSFTAVIPVGGGTITPSHDLSSLPDGVVTLSAVLIPATGPASAAGTDTATKNIVVAGAVLRVGPTFNGGTVVTGSIQVTTASNVTFNGQASVTGDLLVPGTPMLVLNGHPTVGAVVNGTGVATPTSHKVTLGGGASLGRLVQRTNGVALPTVAAPALPAGTRKVSLNNPGDNPGNFATVKDLTLGGNAGNITVPGGTYGTFTAQGNSAFVLGVAGSTTPTVYNFQKLELNGNSRLIVVGPVIVTVKNTVSVSGPSMGAAANAQWLTLRVSNGGLTLNGNVAAYAVVETPNGEITLHGGSTLTGRLAADRLTLNGQSRVTLTP